MAVSIGRLMKTVSATALFALIVAVPALWASWVQDGVAISAATGNQQYPEIVSDGAGGAIVTWADLRSGNGDIYACRVNAAGAVQWTADGVALCTASNEQTYPAIVDDGAGGAIVTWYDNRSGSNYDIYAQRVSASGAVQWTANGIAICSAADQQYYPTIVSDGAGGAIVTWQDYRSGSNYDIYAQRVNVSGAVQWTADGVALCTASSGQWYPTIVSDGIGGAIVTWQDNRGGSYYDIYAQRVSASGAVQWTANGIAICSAADQQYYPTIVSDGAGGAIVTWFDSRSGSNYDIYAQRVNASGAVQWTADGVALCTASSGQWYPTIVSDGIGGAVVTWHDSRSGSHYDIYAQRVNASGAVQWTANGVAICTAIGDQQSPTIASDGAGGAVVTWYDNRGGGGSDIYIQMVNASGAVQWTAGGVALCTASSSQAYPTIVSDGAGGAIVTWYDYRSGSADIYAQFLDALGRIGYLPPRINAVRDIPADQGGCVYLSWYASKLDALRSSEMGDYSIWRAISAEKAYMALAGGASLAESASNIDPKGGRSIIRRELTSAGEHFWQYVASHDAYYLERYAMPVPTLFDSIAGCDEHHYFQVIAHTTDPMVFYISDPDSGYSVDNIAPCPPASLAGKQSFAPSGLNLTWDRNVEADLDHYAVYRGTSADFVPGSGNLVDSPCDTTLLDTGWTWSEGYYYKVSAVDVHRNESGFALLTPDDVTGNETPKVPEVSYLAQNYPNPFNPATRIAFGLSVPAYVSLSVYDVSGRLVRVLAEGERGAGRYEESWDGRDASGCAVASGIYFCRMKAPGYEGTRKMILMR